jgi:hypothetical protein
MVLEEVLGDLRDIVSASRQMLGVPRFGTRSCFGDVKVRDVPVLDQISKLGDNAKLLELAEPFDGKD